MSSLDKMGTLADVVINDKAYIDQRRSVYKLTETMESHIASTTSTDYTHLSNSTTSFNNDISSLENLRNTNPNFITKKSKYNYNYNSNNYLFTVFNRNICMYVYCYALCIIDLQKLGTPWKTSCSSHW